MTSYLPLDLPWDEIKAWHADVCEMCDAAISLCSSALKELREDEQKTEDLRPFDVLKGLLGDDSTCHLFGTPGSEPIILFDKTDASSDIQNQQWGCRMHCHAAAFRHGFGSREKIDHSEQVSHRLILLQIIEDRFATEFKGNTPPVEGFKEAMRHCPSTLVFADFILSYIDPVLHSSLIYLSRPELSKSIDILEFLLNNIRSILARLLITNLEVGLKPPITDDAHLWWGHYELLKREGEEYSVGEKSGYSAAAEVCRKLAYKDSRFFSSPKQDTTIHEIPPDIYCIKRTRLLVVKHCFKIASIMPMDVDPNLSEQLSTCITQHLEAITNYRSLSMYHMGVALQASSTAMLYYKTFVENGSDTKKQMFDPKEHGISKDNGSAQQGGNDKYITRVLLVKTGGLLVEYSDKTTEPLALDKDSRLFKLIRFLIENGGMATQPQLKDKGLTSPGRIIREALENDALCRALEGRLTRPGKRNQGGYTTTIDWWKSESDVDEK